MARHTNRLFESIKVYFIIHILEYEFDSRYNKTGGVVPVVRELSRTGGWYI